MKTPLLAVASTQNSALSWKSPYSCLETRKPLPKSACTMPPSSSRQLALPMGSQLFRLDPSNSVTQPVWAWPDACCACQTDVSPTKSSPRLMANQRFMVMSSSAYDGCRDLDGGNLLRAWERLSDGETYQGATWAAPPLTGFAALNPS